MTIYTFEENNLMQIEKTTFLDAEILERSHLQKAIKNNINVIASDCLVIAEEYSEWDSSKKRIDLLAIDKNANLVVIELKRTETGDHMELQAIRYASMVSTMTLDLAADIFSRYKQINGFPSFDKDSALMEISNFVDIELDESSFADDVRIILVSPNFSKELTTAVMWMSERNINITCIRIQPYTFNGSILIDVQQIIPLPEVKDYQIKAQKKSEERREAKTTSQKDYSKFLFNGDILNKRNLAYEIVKTRFNELSEKTFKNLYSDFIQYEYIDGLMVKYEDVAENKQDRYFFEDNKVLKMDNGDRYVVSNQWGIGNIYKLIEVANNLNYEIIDQSKTSVVRYYEINDHLIEQLEDTTIIVSRNGEKLNAYPFLEKVGLEYGISSINRNGNKKNTRQLGKELLDKFLT
ncbi:PDDEXK family nuclease [Acinetobacter ursingii]|uniref:hypothetical protein n=2 Tax=Acinetobacter ursingii TaxID=108980 RepID=UPI00080A85ED|nr:hypothetical protein [Acinetobacter ursingii]MCH2003904.1 hypothetical protein [Acinetobacter ursingii]MCU4380632.1 hypothetical protein [Acinetobacter ursingii]MCU4482577.1 hypothetical protein [Acinetobacter ursingii]MCU4506982.1 hypothetical protein [Acinetobacter ursingii]MDU4395080.1 hypothetical protein [Acinetobacter ursingii]